jgi:hypothetical protein
MLPFRVRAGPMAPEPQALDLQLREKRLVSDSENATFATSKSPVQVRSPTLERLD